MSQSEMPIFVRTFDFLTWLLPITNHFPKAHRHSFTDRLLSAAFEMRERMEEANFRKGRERIERLRLADEALARIRLYIRLAVHWKWLTIGQYRHGEYASFFIHEPKRRLISAAPFADRVVHHALCNLIEPIFERSFITDSYANRRGKGTHRALNRVQEFARRYRYVLQCDIRQSP